MFSVGETLRQARRKQSLDLCTLAAQTKINVKYLEAIEADDRKSLPSNFFYKSFVDQYARYLSLNTREIAAEVDRVLSADAPLALPGYESVVSRNVSPMKYSTRFHSWRMFAPLTALVLIVAGCAGVFTLWRNWRSEFSPKAVIESVRSLAKTRVAHASSSGQVKAAPVTHFVQTAASVPVSPRYKVMLDLVAHEATWVSVSSDGKAVFSGVLQPNQSKTVGGNESATMRVGNAGGIEVRLNGKLLGPLGARGQVLMVLFTPDSFEVVSAPKESD